MISFVCGSYKITIATMAAIVFSEFFLSSQKVLRHCTLPAGRNAVKQSLILRLKMRLLPRLPDGQGSFLPRNDDLFIFEMDSNKD